MKTQSYRNSYHLASALAFALLIASGVGYRVLWGRYLAKPSQPVLPIGTLGRLPMDLGPWLGRERPLDKYIVRLSATDDHLSRDYALPDGHGAVAVFIGYGARPRDLMPHRPEICYPASGWAMERVRQIEIASADGSTIPAELHHFRRTGLHTQRVATLSYWMVDGEYYPDISGFRWQVLRPGAASDYVIQVHISSSIETSSDKADELVRSFAVEAAPAIRRLLDQSLQRHSDDAIPPKSP